MINNSASGGDLRGNLMSGDFSRKKLAAWLIVTLIALALQGCGNVSSVVKDISPVGPGSDANDPRSGGTPVHMHGQLNEPMSFQVSGTGMCKRMFINFGDGTPPLEVTNVDLSSKPTFTHTYTGWNGQKSVWAYGNWTDDCGGSARYPLRVGPLVFKVGYQQPVPTACTPVPNQPPVRKNSIVTISNLNAGNTTADDAAVIDFGCVGGCFNKAGGLETLADSLYPFPGFRERSLIIRVGAQVIQGGVEFLTNFTTTDTGPLEICINDYKLDDNSGAWGIGVSIDESAAE